MNYKKINKIFLVATAIIQNKDKKILLLKRSKSNKTFKTYWQLPEGKLEDFEKIQKAVDREVLEETGLKIIKKEFDHTSYNTLKLGKNNHLVIRVVFSVKSYTKNVRLSFEHMDYKWLSKEEILLKSKMVPGIKEVVAEI